MQFSEALSVSDIASFNIKNSVEVFNINTMSPLFEVMNYASIKS
jgi:hypothetical protein